MQRVALPQPTLAVVLAHPQPAVALRVIQPIFGGFQNGSHIFRSNPMQHRRRGSIGGIADHPHQLLACAGVECHLTVFDTLERPQQDGDLGEAGRIHHLVAVEAGIAGFEGIGDVDQGYTEVTVLDRAAQAEGMNALFQLVLQRRVTPLGQLRIGLPCHSGDRTHCKQHHEYKSFFELCNDNVTKGFKFC